MFFINCWYDDYEWVLLGGLICDSDDYYNFEQYFNVIYLLKFDKNCLFFIGFFNIGVYQEIIGGFGGLKYCLILELKYVFIWCDDEGKINMEFFLEE